MHIISIEPTPSPHSMKIVLNESLPDGETRNYKDSEIPADAPDYVKELLSIGGVKGIYHVIDFIALERYPKYTWESILPQVRVSLGTAEEDADVFQTNASDPDPDKSFGEVKVYIQTFRNIPMQIKLDDGNDEQRFGLPAMFMEAALEASKNAPNFVMERKWEEKSPRYGALEEIGSEVAEEIAATYDQNRLNQLVELAINNVDISETEEKNVAVSLSVLDDPDWKIRYQVLDRISPSFENITFLDKALQDQKASIRRLATAYLGMLEEPEVLPYLYKALKDSAVTVRRTAGDCISDLGFKEALPEMILSLADPNRLVRWRAAMFIYEVGDQSAITALQNALDDPEFEVRLQAKMALERIQGGEKAKGSVWKQMTEATKQKQ
ncbi:conserved virulence factor C family protein [Radiobacillus sp. PE A8.2]|uniref:conserved virulence factor C family protein n=1 Tax=Radiobacillus sp. PE A8.2 TaxID=3380349 RepID=UPI00388F1402